MTITASSPYLSPRSAEELQGDPAVHLVIWAADWAALVAFWCADEALTDSMVAFQHSCDPAVDNECNCPDLPNPLREASFRAFDLVCRAVLGPAATDRLYAHQRSSSDDIVAALLAIGVRVRRPA